MKGVRIRYGKNKSVQKAFLACNDIILFKYDNDIQVIQKIIQLAKENKIEMKRIHKSVTRILKVKEKYQLEDNPIKKDENFITQINEKIEAVRQQVL